jgi:branched-chain amino acid transport system substrate-binding protein
MKHAAVGGAALATTASGLISPKLARAAERGHILVGLPSPATGPLASFGEGTDWVADICLKEINKDGGIFIKELGKKLPIKIKVVDTQSDPTLGGEVAQKLILRDQIDLMYVLHTPDTVNPIVAMCDNLETPCVSLDAPVDAWLSGGPYTWSYHAFWGVEQVTDTYIGMFEEVKDQTNKSIGVLWQTDPDGDSWRPVIAKKAKALGYSITDTGQFPYGIKDFSSIISAFKRNKVEIVCGNMIAPDFVTFWRQAKQQGFKPKMVTIGRAILFPAQIEALGGDLGEGLTTENWWSPHHPFSSSFDGMTTKELCDRWTKESGKPWMATLGFKYAGYEIIADALNRAQSLDKNEIIKAVAATEINTMVGPVKFNDQNYSETPLTGCQWKADKDLKWRVDLVYNKINPEIPLTGKLELMK